MKGLRQDLLNFIGHRIVVAMQEIKPKLLDDVCSKEQGECAEQEAIYLVGLSDGLALAELLSVGRQGDLKCSKAGEL